MNCRQSIYSLLSPLKLYRLGQNSLIDAELESYLSGLSLVEDALSDLMSSAFIMTCNEEQLTVFERLLSLPVKRGVSLQNRRTMALCRMGISPNDFDAQGILNGIRSAGLSAELVCELPHKVTVKATGFIGDFDNLDEITAAVLSLLPAHLVAELDVGIMTWNGFDGLDLDWDSFHQKNLQFQEFDLGKLMPPEI